MNGAPCAPGSELAGHGARSAGPGPAQNDRVDMHMVNERVIAGFRAGGPMNGMPRDRMLLLTTTGRHSGRPHTVPMMFTTIDRAIIVVASNSGAARHPDWYLNLRADPRVTVETAEGRFEARAHPISPDRRDHLWAEVVEQIPMYAQHQAGTARRIPLVELVPVASSEVGGVAPGDHAADVGIAPGTDGQAHG